jgi:hypothetical protein
MPCDRDGPTRAPHSSERVSSRAWAGEASVCLGPRQWQPEARWQQHWPDQVERRRKLLDESWSTELVDESLGECLEP